MASSTGASAIWCLIIAIDIDQVCPNKNKTQSRSPFILCTPCSAVSGNKVIQKTRTAKKRDRELDEFLSHWVFPTGSYGVHHLVSIGLRRKQRLSADPPCPQRCTPKLICWRQSLGKGVSPSLTLSLFMLLTPSGPGCSCIFSAVAFGMFSCLTPVFPSVPGSFPSPRR